MSSDNSRVWGRVAFLMSASFEPALFSRLQVKDQEQNPQSTKGIISIERAQADGPSYFSFHRRLFGLAWISDDPKRFHPALGRSSTEPPSSRQSFAKG
jgi:hypothetical protein